MRLLAALALLAGLIAIAISMPRDPRPASVKTREKTAREVRIRDRQKRRDRRRARLRARRQGRAEAYARRHALAEVRAGTPISAYGGYVAWSGQPVGSSRYRLWVWHGGRAQRLNVPWRAVPFDVDLGSDAAGRPTAVYSRCTQEPAPQPRPDWSAAGGCRLYAVTLPDGAERAIGPAASSTASRTTPSIWRGDVAFAEQRRGELNPRILLWRAATGTIRELPGGTSARHCRRVSEDCGSVVLQLDLGARILAYNWLLRGPEEDVGYGTGPQWDLRGVHRDSGRAFNQDGGFYSGTCGGLVPDSPAIDRRGFAWLEWPNDCDSPNGGTHAFIVVNDFRRKRWLRVEPPPVHYPIGDLYAMARDGDTYYWLYGPHNDELTEQTAAGDGCAQHACWLLRSSHLDFEPIPDPDPIIAGGD